MDIIEQCQQLLKTKNLDAYLIPTSDPHQSEYISDHFKTRAFLTGFTGSAGTLLITQKDALLWVDGRYHIQAEQQIKDRPIRLMKQGLTTTPSIEEYLKKHFKVRSDWALTDTFYLLLSYLIYAKMSRIYN